MESSSPGIASLLRRSRFAIATNVVVLAAAGLAAGCGSSSSSTSSVAAAKASTSGAASPTSAVDKLVADHMKPNNAFRAPGPAVDAKSLKGKTIWFIPLGAVIPVLGVEAKGIQEAAEGLGVTVKTCDGKLQPAAAASCIKQATDSGADGILIDSVTPQTVAPALKAAAAKKVPVVQMFGLKGDASTYTQYVSLQDVTAHALAADWIIADSKGKANVLATKVVGDAAATNTYVSGGAKQFQQSCPDCKIAEVTSTPTTVPAITASTSSAFLKHPNITYGFPQFDFLAPLFARGAQQAGKTQKIKLVSTNAALSSMKLVKSGQQAADAATNRNYGGWLAVDAWIRMALGKAPQTGDFMPSRIFDKTNIGSVTLTEAASKSGEWFGDTAYKQQFLKSWGV
jgi:ribose transport system substrate-binding protein